LAANWGLFSQRKRRGAARARRPDSSIVSHTRSGDVASKGDATGRGSELPKTPAMAKSLLLRASCRPVWRPSSLTRYINGRTASREGNVPTPIVGGLDDNRGKWGEMPSLVVWRWLRGPGLSLSNRAREARTCPRMLLRRVSIASLKIGQDLFDQPTVANVYAEAKWARPGVGPVALSATATDNNFGVLVGRALTWLS
jgi:hypothetical protein